MGIEAVFGLREDGELLSMCALPLALVAPGSITVKFYLNNRTDIQKLKTAPLGSSRLLNETERNTEIAYVRKRLVDDLRATLVIDAAKVGALSIFFYTAVYVAQHPS